MLEIAASQGPRLTVPPRKAMYLPKGQLLDLSQRAGSTRSCNLYVSMNTCGQFLRSFQSIGPHPCRYQVRPHLLGRSELNADEPQLPGRLRTGEALEGDVWTQ